MDATTFTTTFRSPATATQENATGLLAPFMRAMGHLLFLTAAINAGNGFITEEETQDELDHAKAHLGTCVTVSAETISTTAADLIATANLATTTASESWSGWNEEERKNTILCLVNFYLGVATIFDRELAGIPAHLSNPGSTL